MNLRTGARSGADRNPTMTATRYTNFRDFWPYYLREHSRASTRALHYAGTSLVVGLSVAAVAMQSWWLFALVPVAGYGFAWAGHAFAEHNRPATFTYPTWSLLADFKMWWLWLTGRIGPELAAAGVTTCRPGSA